MNEDIEGNLIKVYEAAKEFLKTSPFFYRPTVYGGPYGTCHYCGNSEDGHYDYCEWKEFKDKVESVSVVSGE